MGTGAGGRPPLRGTRADKCLRLRITSEDKAAIYAAARLLDVSASQFMIGAALRAAARTKKK